MYWIMDQPLLLENRLYLNLVSQKEVGLNCFKSRFNQLNSTYG